MWRSFHILLPHPSGEQWPLTLIPPSTAQGMNTLPAPAKHLLWVKHPKSNFIHKAIRVNPVPTHSTDLETKAQRTRPESHCY